MLTQSRYTRPEAERVQIELLSKASTARRLELGLSLSQTALRIARQAIARANLLASEEEHKLLFVEVTYGKDLADRVRACGGFCPEFARDLLCGCGYDEGCHQASLGI